MSEQAPGVMPEATPEQKLAILTANILRATAGQHGRIVESIIGDGKKATAVLSIIVYSDGVADTCIYGVPDAIEALAKLIGDKWGNKAPGGQS